MNNLLSSAAKPDPIFRVEPVFGMKKRVESGWVEPPGSKFGLDRVGLRFFNKDVLSGWASFNPSTRNSFLSTFCMQMIKGGSECIFSAYFAWRFKLFPSLTCPPKAVKVHLKKFSGLNLKNWVGFGPTNCKYHACCQSLSNKVLRWAIFIVWMTCVRLKFVQYALD